MRDITKIKLKYYLPLTLMSELHRDKTYFFFSLSAGYMLYSVGYIVIISEIFVFFDWITCVHHSLK